ncbi:MAG: FkbM family methyltransferase [Hyphomicrobiaceae bacterium]
MLKTAVKGIAGSLGYDVIRRNGGGTAELSRGIIARFKVHGEDVAFFVQDEWDYIQKHHLKGTFYEAEELELIGRHLKGGTLVDVGANVGNHTVYALKLLGAERVIAFEPNPAAAELLRINLALNGLTGRVTHHLAGLSDRKSAARLVHPGHKDLGSTRVAVGGGDTGGDCLVTTGDEALAGENDIALIKIDTEAMELEVLRGLRRTIERCRPRLFVEVDDANRDAFLSLAESFGLEVAGAYRRYATNCNYLLVPKS